MSFEIELAELLNKHSRENDSNTSDFVLAEFLENCLVYFKAAVNRRDQLSSAKVLKKRTVADEDN